MKKEKKLLNRVLIGAAWCGPCKRVKTFLDNRGVTYSYVDIDTEEGLELAKDWCVRMVPSMNVDGTIITGDSKIMEAFSE